MNGYICDLNENENVNTFEECERPDFNGGFHLRKSISEKKMKSVPNMYISVKLNYLSCG